MGTCEVLRFPVLPCRPHALGQSGVLVTVSRLLSKEVAVLSGLPGNRVSIAEGRTHTRRGDISQRPQCSCGEILPVYTSTTSSFSNSKQLVIQNVEEHSCRQRYIDKKGKKSFQPLFSLTLHLLSFLFDECPARIFCTLNTYMHAYVIFYTLNTYVRKSVCT